MSRHTPGPWKYEYDNSSGGWWFELTGGETPDQKPVISGSYNCPQGELETAEANARLIAASPDLLAAIQDLEFAGILDVRSGDSMLCECARRNARTVYDKATGKEKQP